MKRSFSVALGARLGRRLSLLFSSRTSEREHTYRYYQPVRPGIVTVPSADAVFLERMRLIVEAQMANTNFGVEWLASEIGLCTRQLQRKVRATTGLSAASYIRTLRLQRAAQLLGQQYGSVSEIAYKVGFQDAKHFSLLFKQTFGVPPSRYAARARQQALQAAHAAPAGILTSLALLVVACLPVCA
ncbi:MAG TPA: helix-turn-helix transcriptional regulator [Rhodothermales bacterium]|nr:helix-turn-helix transcriptional regulator [Rhodothermales bacterium]